MAVNVSVSLVHYSECIAQLIGWLCFVSAALTFSNKFIIAVPHCLVFEFPEHGNLLAYLKRNKKEDSENSQRNVCTLPNAEKLRIALNVATGMWHISEKKVGLKFTTLHFK